MEMTLPSGGKIGDGYEPFIIAEVGSNWRTLDDCMISITEAKLAGADAVKFQLFDHESLYGFPDPEGPINPYSLPVSWLPLLKKTADIIDIEFMCSAFSPKLIEIVNPYVNIHKLASAEMCHLRMLEKLRQLGKPVFMSTGGHGTQEIGRSLDCLAGVNASGMRRFFNGVIMYCVSAYPAQEIDLEHIKLFKSTLGTLVGYSDHSLDVCIIPALAYKQGACAIEKHFRALPEIQSPDAPHSLNPRQFKRMVETIRGTASCTQSNDHDHEQKDMILRHNRRLIATQEIKIGEIFREGINFGIYRSLRESSQMLHPFRIGEIKGKKAKKEIKIGDAITEGDV